MPFPLELGLDSAPKLIIFRPPEPLVWSPVIFVHKSISSQPSLHGFLNSHIKEHLRKTYHCVLRMERSIFLLTRGLKRSWWHLGTATWCLWMSVSIFRLVIVAHFPFQPFTSLEGSFLRYLAPECTQ